MIVLSPNANGTAALQPVAGKRVAIWVDGKLIEVPYLEQPLKLLVVTAGYSKAVANKLADRIQRGGDRVVTSSPR